MRTRTKLAAFELIGYLFGAVWMGASVAAVYFLYGVVASSEPWLHLLWSIAIGLAAKLIADALNTNKRRIDYVNQLTERGYSLTEADAAWRTAADGGANLLRNLHYSEFGKEIDRIETVTKISKTEK